MNITNLTGQEPNEDCLHCQLAPFFQKFAAARPQYTRGTQAIIDVSRFLGELIASGVVNCGRRQLLEQVIEMAVTEIRGAAGEVIATVDKVRLS